MVNPNSPTLGYQCTYLEVFLIRIYEVSGCENSDCIINLKPYSVKFTKMISDKLNIFEIFL